MSVELRGLRKTFGRVTALDGIDLTVADGEFIALLGPSGSGKTTLLRVIAGLEFADSGTLLIEGRSVARVAARERSIGFVFQHYALFRHMTVLRNVAFGLSVRPHDRRPSKLVIRERVRSLLDLMEIGDLADRYPDQISGGQRQRVALARALAIEPKLLLLDEPFGALDAKVRRNLRVWLRALHSRLGLTSIFVTHDQSEAIEMADRIALLRAGRLEQVDKPAMVYTEPASAFVYEFMDESVRLDCSIEQGQALIKGIPGTALPAPAASGQAIALIRPHEIGLLPGPGPARVVSHHQTGPLQRIGIMLNDEEFEVLVPAGAAVPQIGETCNLDLSRARIYMRDQTS